MSVFALSEVPTVAKLNQKTVLVDTGANVEAATTYAGMLVFPTNDGATLTGGYLYQRNEANDGWKKLYGAKVKMPAAQASDYVTPSAISAVSSTFTISDNFSSDNFTDTGTPLIAVDAVTDHRLEFDSRRTSVDERSYYDLGASILGDVWIMQFTAHALSFSGQYAIFVFGVSSALENYNGGAGDGVCFEFGYNGSNPRLFLVKKENGSNGAGELGAFATSTTYYVTLERTSAIEAKLSVFSDSGRTTHIAGSPITIALSGVTGLRYIQGSNYNDNAGAGYAVTGWIDDLIVTANGSSFLIDESTTSFWKSASEATPYIEIDLGSDLLLSGMRAYWNASGQPNGYDIDTKPDGGAYTERVSNAGYPDGGSGTSAGWVEESWNTVIARYIRVQGDGTLAMQIAEVDSYTDTSDYVLINHIHEEDV